MRVQRDALLCLASRRRAGTGAARRQRCAPETEYAAAQRPASSSGNGAGTGRDGWRLHGGGWRRFGGGLRSRGHDSPGAGVRRPMIAPCGRAAPLRRRPAAYGGPQPGPQPPQQRRAARRRAACRRPMRRRLVPDEVVIELRNSVTPQTIDALQRRFRLTRIESQPSQLTGTTLYRWRIPDRRSVAAVVRALEGDARRRLGAAELSCSRCQQRAGKPTPQPNQRRRRSGAIRTRQAAAAASARHRQGRQRSGRGDRFRRRRLASGTRRRDRADLRRARHAAVRRTSTAPRSPA